MFLALPALVLASCSNDEAMDVAKGAGISFEPAMAKGSRAVEMTTAALQEFNVTSYADDGTIFFKNVNIKRNGTAWDSEYLWPNYDLNFGAYSPVSYKENVSIDKDAFKFTGVKIAQKLADQQDLIVAYNKHPESGKKVQLAFDHAFFAVDFKAKVVNPNLKYEIIAVKLCNLKSKGDFTMPTAATTVEDGNDANKIFDYKAWSNLSEPASYINRLDAADAVVLDSKTTEPQFIKNDACGYFMPIPQYGKAWDTMYTGANGNGNGGTYVSILCRISQSDNAGNYNVIYPKDDTKYGFAALPIEQVFQPGKKYTIVLSLDGGGYRDPKEEDPDDPGEDPEIDPDPDPQPGPDPILPGKISYEVIVNDLVDGGNINLDYKHPDNN